MEKLAVTDRVLASYNKEANKYYAVHNALLIVSIKDRFKFPWSYYYILRSLKT